MKLNHGAKVARALAAAGPLLIAEVLMAAATDGQRPEGVWMVSDTARNLAIAWRYVEIGKSRLTLDAINDGRMARRWIENVDAPEGNYTLIPITIVPVLGRLIEPTDIVAIYAGPHPNVVAVGLLPERGILAGPDKPTSFMAVFPLLDLTRIRGFSVDGIAGVDTLVEVNSWK